jgi:putative IMPACT (imprinted ancient) family translation regulator
LQKELKNVLVVVVRYFGGIKLGAGGWSGHTAEQPAEAVNKAGIVRMVLEQSGCSIN